MRFSPSVLLLLALSAAPPRLYAQAIVRGAVSDAVTEQRLPAATITLLDLNRGGSRQLLGTETGEFAFLQVQPGHYRLQVFVMGFAPALTDALRVADRDTLVVPVRLTAGAIPLDSLLVVAHPATALHPTIENFHIRRQRATTGVFITREEIEARAPSQLWDLVRARARTERSLRNLMARRDPCQMEVFVDGWNPRRGLGEPLENFLNRFSPHDIEGIEIYRNASGLPAELATPKAQECGVIAIWTRRGG